MIGDRLANMKHWIVFAVLGVIWGSSFLFIKIALGEVSPVAVVAFSYLFGLVGMIPLTHVIGRRFPRDRSTYLCYLFIAVFNGVLPFFLTSWGETRIDSGLASILNGTVPLFTIIIAHFWLSDERITTSKALGLAVGFLGVVILVGGTPSHMFGGTDLFPHLAVLSAAICYAISLNFIRKYLSTKPAVAQTTMMLLFSNLMLWSVMPLVEHPIRIPLQLTTWSALVVLGLASSSAGYYLYFHLISAWGATRASLVNYVFPIIGLFLGVTYLGETVTLGLISGSFLVVVGVLLTSASGPIWMLTRRNR